MRIKFICKLDVLQNFHIYLRFDKDIQNLWAYRREIIFKILILGVIQNRIGHNSGNDCIFFLSFIFIPTCICFLANIQNSFDQLMNSFWSIYQMGQHHTTSILKPFWSKSFRHNIGILENKFNARCIFQLVLSFYSRISRNSGYPTEYLLVWFAY